MTLKLLTVAAAFSFCCQVIFSIYYSTSIVDQNSLINIRQTTLDNLSIENEQLQINLADLNSLTAVVGFLKNHPSVPVTSSLGLN